MVKKILILLGALIIVGGIYTWLASNAIIRCYFVKWSDLKSISHKVYVDRTMPEFKQQQLLKILDKAIARIETLYGQMEATPIIIAGHSMDVMQAYGGNVYNRMGRTYVTMVESFIILGPEGSLSVDVIAHELGHVEFTDRVGYWQKKNVPNWFDEGLALQFDHRYTEDEWQIRTDQGRLTPELDNIGNIKHDDWAAYATAKHEVGNWLDAVGTQGLQSLLEALRDGHDFTDTYQSIENTGISFN